MCCFEYAGGQLVQRSEAFLVGRPLAEIATALSLSAKNDIILAPSAARLLAHVKGSADALRITELQQGHVRMLPGASEDSMVALPPFCATSRSANQQGGLSELMRRRAPHEELALLPNRLLKRMHEITQDDRYLSRSWCDLSVNPSSPSKLTTGSSSTDSSRRWEIGATSTRGGAEVSTEERMGMDALLRFMPSFVQRSCLEGHGNKGLMEHRMVAILFVIADLKVRYSLPGVHCCGVHPCSRSKPVLPLSEL